MAKTHEKYLAGVPPDRRVDGLEIFHYIFRTGDCVTISVQGVLVSRVRRQILVTSASIPVLVSAGTVRAQATEKIRRVGLLSPLFAGAVSRSFREGLRELGWIEGKNLVIEARYAEGKEERLLELAADLTRLKLDVIVALTPPADRIAQQATGTIPLVLRMTRDPVSAGWVTSLARPGGNVTGLSQMAGELTIKRLELLKELVPKLARVAVVHYPLISAAFAWNEIQVAAQKLQLQLLSLEVRNAEDFDKVFEAASRARVGALFVSAAPLIGMNLQRVALLAAMHRLPSIYHVSDFATLGGLASYGANEANMARRAAVFVDKILKGTSPGDLPIEQPTNLELVINLHTARALRLTVPQSVLVRATKVIG